LSKDHAKIGAVWRRAKVLCRHPRVPLANHSNVGREWYMQSEMRHIYIYILHIYGLVVCLAKVPNDPHVLIYQGAVSNASQACVEWCASLTTKDCLCPSSYTGYIVHAVPYVGGGHNSIPYRHNIIARMCCLGKDRHIATVTISILASLSNRSLSLFLNEKNFETASLCLCNVAEEIR
jgi:hypothetical protein